MPIVTPLDMDAQPPTEFIPAPSIDQKFIDELEQNKTRSTP